MLATKAQTENRGNSWQLSDAQLDDQRPRKNALLSPGARPELRIPHAAATQPIFPLLASGLHPKPLDDRGMVLLKGSCLPRTIEAFGCH